jgi:hypothetical protein
MGVGAALSPPSAAAELGAARSDSPRHHYPPGWLAEARCIAAGLAPATGRRIILADGRPFWGESGGNPAAGGEQDRGLYQFAPRTWLAVGGRGDPARATRAEQTYRAFILWRRRGGWRHDWPNTARICGLA